MLLDNRLVVHMFRPLVDLVKVLCNDLFHRLAIFEDLRVLSFNFSLDPGHDWMTSLDLEDLIGHLVELLQLAFSQQLTEVLNVLRFFKRACDRQFLLLLLDVIPVVVPDRYVLSLLLHFPGISRQLINDCLFREELVRWILDRVLCRQHVAYRLLRLD